MPTGEQRVADDRVGPWVRCNECHAAVPLSEAFGLAGHKRLRCEACGAEMDLSR